MNTAPSKAIRLDDFVPQDTAELHVKIPGTERPLGWIITFGGPSHPKTVAAAERASRKDLQRSNEIEKAKINGRKWKGDMDKAPDEVKREFIQTLVDRMVDWSPVALGDKEYPFTEATAVELLIRPEMSPYVNQIVEFLLDDKAFMKASAISS